MHVFATITLTHNTHTHKKHHNFWCFLDPIVSHLSHKISSVQQFSVVEFSFFIHRQHSIVVQIVSFASILPLLIWPMKTQWTDNVLCLFVSWYLVACWLFSFLRFRLLFPVKVSALMKCLQILFCVCVCLLSIILFGQCKLIHIKLADFISWFTNNPGSKDDMLLKGLSHWYHNLLANSLSKNAHFFACSIHKCALYTCARWLTKFTRRLNFAELHKIGSRKK